VKPPFTLGHVVATPGALAAIEKAGQQPGEFLSAMSVVIGEKFTRKLLSFMVHTRMSYALFTLGSLT
jgi:hypothetical protein